MNYKLFKNDLILIKMLYLLLNPNAMIELKLKLTLPVEPKKVKVSTHINSVLHYYYYILISHAYHHMSEVDGKITFQYAKRRNSELTGVFSIDHFRNAGKPTPVASNPPSTETH